jgi:hypothetical protein
LPKPPMPPMPPRPVPPSLRKPPIPPMPPRPVPPSLRKPPMPPMPPRPVPASSSVSPSGLSGSAVLLPSGSTTGSLVPSLGVTPASLVGVDSPASLVPTTSTLPSTEDALGLAELEPTASLEAGVPELAVPALAELRPESPVGEELSGVVVPVDPLSEPQAARVRAKRESIIEVLPRI